MNTTFDLGVSPYIDCDTSVVDSVVDNNDNGDSAGDNNDNGDTLGNNNHIEIEEVSDESKTLTHVPAQETFYSESTTAKLKALYGDRTKLLAKILDMYKFIFKQEKKQIWEKTAADIDDDVMSAKYDLNLDNIVKESYAEILNANQITELINKKTAMIPILLDFCYVYYVGNFDEDAPFHRLPTTHLKYCLITRALHAYGTDIYANINSIFEQIINNTFFKDLRIETPPYYLRTELTQTEIKEKLAIVVKPICKDLVNYLLKLKAPTPCVKISIIDGTANGTTSDSTVYKESLINATPIPQTDV
jgi:hypothetical protein